jgi:hypothetical protein
MQLCTEMAYRATRAGGHYTVQSIQIRFTQYPVRRERTLERTLFSIAE